MKKILRLAIACWLLAPVSSYAETISIVADEWCPYNCAKGTAASGFMIEIAKKIFGDHGITIEYSTMPWEQAIEETRQGKHTAIVGASKNDAADFIFPTLEQGWMQNQFFVKKGSAWHYLGKDSLSQVVIGVAAGYTYGATVDGYIQANRNNLSRVQMASGDDVLAVNVKKLLGDKVGVVIEDVHVMGYYLAQSKLQDKIAVAGKIPISDQNNLYIAFSPKEKSAKQYAKMLDEGMAEIRANGELAKILAKYSITDWRQP